MENPSLLSILYNCEVIFAIKKLANKSRPNEIWRNYYIEYSIIIAQYFNKMLSIGVDNSYIKMTNCNNSQVTNLTNSILTNSQHKVKSENIGAKKE